MKAYHFLLFTIYRFYTDRMKEESVLLFSVTVASTVIIYVGLFTIYAFANYVNLIPMFPNKFYVVGAMTVIGLLNYYFIIRHKKFLSYNFKKDVKGGFLIIAYIVLTAVAFIIVANLNRDKLEKQRLANPVKTEEVQIKKDEKPKSLEGRIRKWFGRNF